LIATNEKIAAFNEWNDGFVTGASQGTGGSNGENLGHRQWTPTQTPVRWSFTLLSEEHLHRERQTGEPLSWSIDKRTNKRHCLLL
jgi:hypothetical protein